MAKVNLKAQFFGPDGHRYKPSANPHNFPDDWTLPKRAEVVEEEKKPAPKAKAE